MGAQEINTEVGESRLAALVDPAATAPGGLAAEASRWRAAAEALAEIARTGAGEGGVPRVLEVVTGQALAVVGGEACAVFVLEGPEGSLRLARSVGLEGQPGAGEPIPFGVGVAGRAVAGRAPATSGEETAGVGTLDGLFSAALAVPMVVGGELFGALALYRRQPDAFSDLDIRLLDLIGLQAGIVLQNARLQAESLRLREDAEALRTLGRLVPSSLDVKTIMRAVVERTCQLLGVSRCAIWEARQRGTDLHLTPLHSVGLSPSFTEASRLALGEGVTGACIARCAPRWAADVLEDPSIRLSERSRRRVEAEGYRAVCAAPLLLPEGPFGALTIYRDDRHAFAEREVALLGALAQQAAVAIANGRLYAETASKSARLEALHCLAVGVASTSLDLQRVLDAVVRAAADLFGDAGSNLWLVEADGETVSLQADISRHPALRATTRMRLGEGMVGWVVRHRAPLVIDDVQADARMRNSAWARAEGFRALAGVPLLRGDRCLGALSVNRRSTTPFSREELDLMASLAAHAAIAIENARLFQQEQERRRQLEAVRAVAEEIARELDLATLLDLISRRAAELLGASSGAIFLWDEAEQVLVPRAWQGLGDWIREVRLRLGEGLPGVVAQRRQGLVVNDYRDWPGAHPLVLERTQITANLAEPLLYHDELLGVITIDTDGTGRRFTAQDQELLALIAGQAAIAIANARLYAEDREALEELEAIHEAGQAIAQSLDLQKTLQHILAAAMRLTDSDKGTIHLLDEERQELVETSVVGVAREPVARLRLSEPSLAAACLREGRVLTSESPDTDPRCNPGLQARYRSKALIAVPLRSGSRVLGVLDVGDRKRRRAFGPREVGILERLAQQAVVAIENAQLYEQALQTAEEIAALYEAGEAVTASLDLDATLGQIAESARRLARADRALVWLVDPQEGTLRAGAVSGAGGEAFPGTEVPADSPAAVARAVREGRPLVVEDLQEPGRADPVLSARLGNAALVALPLHSPEGAVGVLVCGYNRPRAFARAEVDRLAGLAQQAAIAIQHARLFGEVLRSKSEWENTFDSISDLVAVLDPEGRVVRANRTLLQRLALPPEQVLGRPCGEVFGDGGPPWGGCPHQRAVRLGVQVSLEVEDGRLGGNYSVGVFPVRDDRRQVIGTVHIARDITEQKGIQAKLFQSEKLAAMGTLAAGVAHSINNVLAAIVARADLVLSRAVEPETRRSVQVIQQAALDGAETVRRLQDFAKVRPAGPASLVDLNQGVRDALELTRARWREEAQARGAPIAVETCLEARGAIEGNAAEIREVLVNLILNATDAMPRGGRLRIVSADRPGAPSPAPAATPAGTAPAGLVELRVEDTGAGMPEPMLRRIFDPFFTTKGVTGTGLGLSVSYGLVAKHGGEIAVNSREGEGTIFTLTFPMVGQTAEGAGELGAAAPRPPGRVLLIEDEPALREALAETLRLAGHQVEAVGGGREGIQRFRPGAFDVVLTDLGMPEVSGLDVARAVKAADPSVYVILCTGWGNVPGADQPLQERGVDALLAKPFRITEVAQVVGAGLEARAAATG